MLKISSVLIITTVLCFLIEILPIRCHKFITNPYPISEWDHIIVSSDPIKIREKKLNETNPLKLQDLKAEKRSFNDCPQNDFKCLYGIDKEKSNQIVDRFLDQYSNNDDETTVSDSETDESDNSRKSYWSMIDSKTHHHPYDDKHGWVTLDPVPWSTSKISKWHPNKVGDHQNKPWGYGSTTQRPVQQFWVSGSSFNTDRPTTQWGIGTNDIITDNKPSGFPTENYNNYGNYPQGVNHHPENAHSDYLGSYKEHQQGFKGHYPAKLTQKIHPPTYPSSGNGEWILLSTTKGYSAPQPHRWGGNMDSLKSDERSMASRKIKPLEISRYHEEDLNDKFVMAGESSGNRKSDLNMNTEGSTNNLSEEVNTKKSEIQVLYTGPEKPEDSVKTIKRKVRLHVLPSLEPTSTSHGGLLEVESNTQTVEEAQQLDEKLKKLTSLANVKKNKFRGFRLIPMSRVTGKGMSQNSAVTLAAVGAGMIPATMAILVPMALGKRRRRSIPEPLALDSRLYTTKSS